MWRSAALVVIVMAATLFILWMMGRIAVCGCGLIKFWGPLSAAETSQHFTDWYSLSHIIHGFLFYGGLWLVLRNWSVGARLALAVAIEGGWEIFENTSLIIERYRNATMSLDYYGDSLLNSTGDLLSMIAGFAIAMRMPIWATVLLGITMELLAGVVIRDNLTLNIIMLIWPVEFIKNWQMGG